MISYSVSEARKHWKTVLELVEIEKKHVFITKNGKIQAVLVPFEEYEAAMLQLEAEKDA